MRWIRLPKLTKACYLASAITYFAVLVGSGLSQYADDRNAIGTALSKGDNSTALQLLPRALKKSPNDAVLWTMQAVAHERQGDSQQALPSFQRALQISPDYIPALEGAIQILFQESSPKAIPLLERMLRQRPSDETSHGMLAVLEYQQGKCSSAAVHFEKARKLFDTKPEALHAYGACLVKLQRFEEAAGVFERSLSANEGNAMERQLLASVELMAHVPQRAIATLEPLLQAGNADPQTLELAANAYEDAGDTDKAVSILRQAILRDPQNRDLYVDFANLSAAHDSAQVGINVVSDGIAQLPDAAQLYLARGVLYVQLADYGKAEADLEKAYELDPSQSLTAAAQGLLAVQQNDLDRALTDVREKLKRKPEDPLLLYLQADVLAQKGAEPGTADFKLALQSAKKAVALRPGLGAAHAVLGKLYFQSGENLAAAEQCRKALQIDPKDQASLYRLIQVLRKTGDTAETAQLLKRLAEVRKTAAKEQKQRSRYKLVEGDS